MDEEAANVFMTNLVKNIQMLCHGHLPFSDNVEVIGHLYLNIDCGKKLNYIVNEKYSKLNQATTFTSNSFHAEPSKDKSSNAKNSNAIELHGNVRKYKRAAKSLSVSSSPSKVRKIQEEYTDDPVNDVNDSVDNSLGVTFSIQRNDNDQERLPCINTSNIIIKSETNQHTFKTEVENPTLTLGDPSDVQYASGSTSNPNDSYSSFYSPGDGVENEEGESDEIMGRMLQNQYKDEDIEYTIIEMGTQQGRPMLVDSIGYCYTMRKKTDLCVRWWCSLRNKHGRCPGSVAQRGESFKRGSIQHTHDPKPGLLTAKLVVAEARAQANNDFVTPISEVVERAMSVKGTEDESILPKQKFEDFQAATNQTMLAVSGYTAEEVLYSKDPSIQPLLSSIIKEASIQCGIWEQVPYPKDIPTHTREMFFDFVLSIAPQLESHRDVIWSKLSHRLRDRRFKQKLKKARFFK